MKTGSKSFKRGLVIFLVLALLLSFTAANLFAAPGIPNPGSSPVFTSDKVEVLIGFYGQPDRKVVTGMGGEIYTEFTIVNVIAARMAPQAAEALDRNPRVAYVEPDSPKYAQQTLPWGIDRVFGSEGYPFETWSNATGEGVGVAVLDTGIDKSHVDLPELKDGTNTVDDTYFWEDGNSHGTHVAGTIAALSNDFGVVGVAPQVDLYAVKVLSDIGSGSDSTVMLGIEWAVVQKIPVINMSLGGDYSQSLHNACNAAYEKGHLLIASAGNNGLPSGRGDNVSYPAGYDSVIAVAASDSGDKRARFSSTGPAVELIAPGVSILSTIPGNSYGSKSGTSMAAPHVSGVAALVWAADPNLANHELRTVLQGTAEDLGLTDIQQGYGLVRADLAVAAVAGVTEPDPVEKYTLSLEVSPEGAGRVSGGGHYEAGESVNISATAAQDYEFVSWTEGETLISEVESFNYTMPARDVILTANFEEQAEEPGDPDPATDMVTVSSIDYTAPGPHLRVTVTVVEVDEAGNSLPNAPVAGAAVSINLYLNGVSYISDKGTTDSDGKVTFSYQRVPSGAYSTVVTAVDAAELNWDGEYPENSYTK